VAWALGVRERVNNAAMTTVTIKSQA